MSKENFFLLSLCGTLYTEPIWLLPKYRNFYLPKLQAIIYCTSLQVDFLYSSSVVTVVPRQQVILDKTGCTPPTPTPTQPGSPFTAATCARLQKTAANTGIIFTCSVEDGCTGLTCHGLNHRMDLTIIPCNTPPAFNVMLFNSSNALIYNKNITNQTTIPVVEGIGWVQVKESQDGVKLKVCSASKSMHWKTELNAVRCTE